MSMNNHAAAAEAVMGKSQIESADENPNLLSKRFKSHKPNLKSNPKSFCSNLKSFTSNQIKSQITKKKTIAKMKN